VPVCEEYLAVDGLVERASLISTSASRTTRSNDMKGIITLMYIYSLMIYVQHEPRRSPRRVGGLLILICTKSKGIIHKGRKGDKARRDLSNNGPRFGPSKQNAINTVPDGKAAGEAVSWRTIATGADKGQNGQK
jgi:hypothetical protein